MGQPVGTIFEYTVVGNVNGQKCMTVLHYCCSAPSAIGDPQDETSALMSELEPLGSIAVIANMQACQSGEYNIDYTRGQLFNANRFSYVRHVMAIAGTIAEPCSAQNVNATITKRTQYSGRNQVGSVHLPGLADSEYESGLITTGAKVFLDDFAREAKKTIAITADTGRYFACVWHREETFPVWADQWKSWITQPEVRVMRRRTVGLGI